MIACYSRGGDCFVAGTRILDSTRPDRSATKSFVRPDGSHADLSGLSVAAAVPDRGFLLYLSIAQAPGGALNLLSEEKQCSMGKSQPKRRTATTRTHQSMKGNSGKKKSVNWVRIALIIIGIMIVISMILSMLVVPGT
jgi:hypothetical protein